MRDSVRYLFFLVAMTCLVSTVSAVAPFDSEPFPTAEFAPRSYTCIHTSSQITIDGVANEPVWAQAFWSEEFVDIEGSSKPRPEFSTRMKMLWDDANLYIYAEMEEPHLWGTLRERDAVIFFDNDFEVFIDPDGDTHNYVELEVNALGTEWDLLITMPYRDDGHAVDGYNIPGLQTAVHLDGALNNPSDTDKGWSIEIAMPWKAFEQVTTVNSPPDPGEYWRINFSRVQWKLDQTADGYTRRINPETGTPFPESNWVWSPQGLIAMHYPELWGYVIFTDDQTGTDVVSPATSAEEQLRWWMRNVYYQQRVYSGQHRAFVEKLDDLDNVAPLPEGCHIQSYIKTIRGYELIIKLTQSDTLYVLTEDGSIIEVNLSR